MDLRRMAFRLHPTWRLGMLLPLASAALLACGGGGDTDVVTAPPPVLTPTPTPEPGSLCVETGPYACQTGSSEPLYTFQWVLNYRQSYFQTNADAGAFGGGMDMNVEPVHRQGIKGQGVNVLLVDTGVDLEHEDLRDNAHYGMSWNYENQSADPSPLRTRARHGHGTMVAGIIGAAQNGKGAMGIAPQVRLGAVPLIGSDTASESRFIAALGGASWSQQAHVINASYGGNTDAEPYTLASGDGHLIGARNLPKGRGGKGIVYVKAAGNSFDAESHENSPKMPCGPHQGLYECYNPANDTMALEPTSIVTAALNAKGESASYSAVGSVMWVTGLGGEYASVGRYGEGSGLTSAQITAGQTGNGPTVLGTDMRGCSEGFSRTVGAQPDIPFARGESELVPGIKDNPNCDYGTMNGTSAAAATVTGVVALMLSANPDLTWRDVRDILRLSARAMDQRYAYRTRSDLRYTASLPYNALFDLETNRFIAQSGGPADIAVGSRRVPVELGWQRNAAGNLYSNWYGFGVPDAAKAVELAQLYKREPARSKPSALAMPEFSVVRRDVPVSYSTVSLLGEFEGGNQTVDQFQVRLSSDNVCLGSLGLAVESPSGTKSLLKMPLDHFAFRDWMVALNAGRTPVLSEAGAHQYGAGSYAFYGENAKGRWKIYALASNPNLDPEAWDGLRVSCDAAGGDDPAKANPTVTLEARVIAQ